MSAVGFVGLGAMGSRFAGRLLEAGNELGGKNRTRSKAQPLLDRGMQWCASPVSHKDTRLARDAADELATPLPTAAVADQMLTTRASELGYEHRDLAAIYQVLAESAAT